MIPRSLDVFMVKCAKLLKYTINELIFCGGVYDDSINKVCIQVTIDALLCLSILFIPVFRLSVNCYVLTNT